MEHNKLDIQHIAELAKLEIPEDKQDAMAEEMAAIVKMVENLPALNSADALLDTDNTMPLREDVVHPSFARKDILRNAPQVTDGCFVVPKTVE